MTTASVVSSSDSSSDSVGPAIRHASSSSRRKQQRRGTSAKSRRSSKHADPASEGDEVASESSEEDYEGARGWRESGRRSRRETSGPLSDKYVSESEDDIEEERRPFVSDSTSPTTRPRSRLPPPSTSIPVPSKDIHDQFNELTRRITDLRALASRLRNSPDDISLSTSLRDSLQHISTLLLSLDDEIEASQTDHTPRRDVRHPLTTTGDSYESMRSEMERIVYEMKRESKQERNVRKGSRVSQPTGLSDWFVPRMSDALVGEDLTSITQFVARNPFSTLAQMTSGNLKDDRDDHGSTASLSKTSPRSSRPPKRSRRHKTSKYPSSPPTTLRSSNRLTDPTPIKHHRPFSWKFFQREKKAYHDIEENIEHDLDEGLKEMKAVARFGTRERWILFVTLALIPALLAAIFVENPLGVRGPPGGEREALVEGPVASQTS